jgi:hypothetical protein
MFEKIDVNLIEGLAEIRDTLQLINPNAYKDLFSGKGVSKLSRIKDLFSIFSSATLLWKYGLAPTLADAQKIVGKIGPVLESFKALNDQVLTLYGTESYTIPGGAYGYETVKVLASSKVVGRTNLTTFFLATYFANAIGILPTTERLWDLVPYSFVLDMFFNVDDRLAFLDSGILTAGFLLDYHVSSVRITAEFGTELLDEFDLQESGTQKSGLRLFVRDISRFAPRLGSSAYDFAPPAKPDWLALGALIFLAIEK